MMIPRVFGYCWSGFFLFWLSVAVWLGFVDATSLLMLNWVLVVFFGCLLIRVCCVWCLGWLEIFKLVFKLGIGWTFLQLNENLGFVYVVEIWGFLILWSLSWYCDHFLDSGKLQTISIVSWNYGTWYCGLFFIGGKLGLVSIVSW